MRLDKALSQYRSEQNKGAYFAFERLDGSYLIDHHIYGRFELSSQDFQEFVKENNLDKGDKIRLIIISPLNAEGERPEERTKN